MTSDKGGGETGSGSKKPPAASRRPAPTIDLKATELASEPVANERRPADETVEAPAPDAAAKVSPDPKVETEADGAPPPRGPDRSRRPTWDRLRGLSLPLIGAAAAAGVVFFLLGLATANLFPGREMIADARLQAVDDLSGRLAKIETTLSVPRAPDAALGTRIAAAEAAAKLATENAATQQRRADELAALVREVRNRADAAAASAEAAQKGASAVTSGGVPVDVDALNQRIASLEQSLKATEAELTRRAAAGADDRKGRVAVASSILLGAVERGVPFTAELAAVKGLTQDAKALAPLEPFAANGVPGAAALSRELAATIPAMLKATERETAQDGGFLDKLQANAERLVRIRPVGDVAGDQPAHVVARIEAKLKVSDVAGALEELGKLPAQVRAPADAWIKRANARNAALAAARQLSIGALAALGKPNT